MCLFYSIRPYNEIILLDRVVHTIERHRMFTPGDRVAVAVSGGADSVCLLHVLLDLAPRWDLTLSVLHVNHNLRGDASRDDAEFVRTVAAGRNLPFTLCDLDLSNSPGNLEESARRARLAFFHDQLGGGAATRVAVGHTRSDQAETVLFRFLRGSGATGLAAIRPLTDRGDGAVLMPPPALAPLPLAAGRRLVRRAIQLAGGGHKSSGFSHIGAVLGLVARLQGNGRTQLPGIEVQRSFDWLRLAPDAPDGAYTLRPAVQGITRIPGTDLAISLELLANSETTRLPNTVYNSQMGCLDWNRLSGTLELRSWRPGDQYQPMGFSAAKKIKALFQQARIPD